MGDATSGGGVDTDVGGAGQDTGGGRDTSPSTPASLGFGGARGDIVARTPSAPSFGMSPGAMGGRVPDVQPTVMRSFDPGVYSQPVSPSVMAGNPAIPSLATNDAYQANLDFISGIRSLAGGQSPGAMGGRIGDDSPTFSSQPDPSTALPLRVDTQAAPRIRFNPVTNELLRDQTGRVVFDDMSRQPTRTMIAADETGTERQALRMLPINEPMGGGRILPELEADPFAPLGGTGVSPEAVRSRRFDEPDPGAIVGPLRTVTPGSLSSFQGIDPFAPIGDDKTPPSPTEMTDFITPILPTPAARPSVIDTQPKTDANAAAAKLAALARSGSGGAKTKEELNLLQRLGRFLKGVGKSISNFEMSDIFEFLKGDPNFKGPSAAQQQLMGVPGPGPAVGGGAPSPSGGGGMPMPAKDPCPPGFRFDPTLQQCVPIIAPNTPTDTTTTPTTPTTPAPGTSPPAAGGIADAYPFVLTPPIGTPVGNLPPVRLTT